MGRESQIYWPLGGRRQYGVERCLTPKMAYRICHMQACGERAAVVGLRPRQRAWVEQEAMAPRRASVQHQGVEHCGWQRQRASLALQQKEGKAVACPRIDTAAYRIESAARAAQAR